MSDAVQATGSTKSCPRFLIFLDDTRGDDSLVSSSLTAKGVKLSKWRAEG
jgi:hypothetical protein